MSTGRKMVRGRERYFHGRSFYKYGKQHDQGYIHNKIFIEKIEKVEINLFKNDWTIFKLIFYMFFLGAFFVCFIVCNLKWTLLFNIYFFVARK